MRGQFTNSTGILVQWGKVPVDKQHGEIKHYMVTYQKTEGGDKLIKIVNAPTKEATLTELAKYTFYSIRVSAATVKGYGPASNATDVRTDEDSK